MRARGRPSPARRRTGRPTDTMPNRLAAATSPYLRQHADNPVDWHEWGPEALELARATDRPVLLSIGYSACHWCHVMAHESFEDDEVARAMNALFVNVKVDREERPDLDRIYQTAHALLTRRPGGWPLTVFVAPDGTPFFAGTYFPRHGAHGRPGMLELLPRVAAAWREQRDAIVGQSGELAEAMRSIEPDSHGPVPAGAAEAALAGLERAFDTEHGGFGTAPKFPHPAELAFLMDVHARVGDGAGNALAMVRRTLDAMADGGIHDQLAGGFCRYSVDARWSIPHFEKMLYDNGPLLALYADLARVTGEARYADVARGIVGWMDTEMRATDGAYYASIDADSEGEEGRYYVWARDDVRAALDDGEWAIASRHYGLDGPPNFEGRAWHLRVVAPLADIAARLGIALDQARATLDRARAKLLAVRSTRVRPGLDDKVLTSWNALAITGLARAARALDEPAYAGRAFAALDGLAASVWRDGRLHATRRGREPALAAYLDDHAFLLEALVEAMRARWRRADYDRARLVAEALIGRFEDPDGGGFWFTAHDHERLFHRTMPGHDDATPSGNGVAARALIALGHLSGERRYLEAAGRAVRRFGPAIAESPGGHSTLLSAARWLDRPPAVVLIAGEPTAARAWHAALERRHRPDTLVVDLGPAADLPPELAKGPLPPRGARAWVCRDLTCLPPADDLAALRALVDG